MTKWSGGPELESAAASYAESGDFDSAIKWQTAAVGSAAYSSPQSAKQLQAAKERLKQYRSKTPWRFPEMKGI
jgi:hypothetical protein